MQKTYRTGLSEQVYAKSRSVRAVLDSGKQRLILAGAEFTSS